MAKKESEFRSLSHQFPKILLSFPTEFRKLYQKLSPLTDFVIYTHILYCQRRQLMWHGLCVLVILGGTMSLLNFELQKWVGDSSLPPPTECDYYYHWALGEDIVPFKWASAMVWAPVSPGRAFLESIRLILGTCSRSNTRETQQQ